MTTQRETELLAVNAALEAEIVRLREALRKLACLGNGDSYGNSTGNCIAQEALAATPESALSEVRKAEREHFAVVADGESTAREIRAMGDE